MPILDLTKMTKDELLRLADKIKIPVKKTMLKGEILTVLKRETKKAAKLAEAKKTKAGAVKSNSKKALASGGKVAAKKPAKAAETKKSTKPKSTKTTTSAKPKVAAKTPTPAKKAKPIVAKDKAHNAPLKSVPGKKGKRPVARKKPVSRSASGLTGRQGYDVQSLHPKFELEDAAQEAKFILGKPDIRDESRAEVSAELPLGYGDNKIVMLVRDPHWCYLYWELQDDNIEGGLQRLSRSRSEVRHVLRIHPVSGEGSLFDVDVDFRHRSHYLRLSPGASFYTEIGLLDHEGHFAALAVSNTITLPLDAPSEVIDEQWITTDENFTEIYMLSGGELSGKGKTRRALGQAGSAELQKAGLKLSSSGVGSFGSAQIQEPRQEINFGHWLDAELVLYGGADLGSTIQLSGKNLDLRPDGTFTARFALPEGTLDLPVTFISPDRSKVHTVTPNINRHTEFKTGGSGQ